MAKKKQRVKYKPLAAVVYGEHRKLKARVEEDRNQLDDMLDRLSRVEKQVMEIYAHQGGMDGQLETLEGLVNERVYQLATSIGTIAEVVGQLAVKADVPFRPVTPSLNEMGRRCLACSGTGGGETRMGGPEWTCDVCHGTGFLPAPPSKPPE